MNNLIVILSFVLLFSPSGQDFFTRISVKTEELKDPKENYEIRIEHPVCNDNRGDTLNALVAEFISDLSQSFIQKCHKDNQQPSPWAQDLNHDLDISLQDHFSTNEIVSYCFVINTYFAGAPHGNVEYRTFNFDLTTQKLLKPRDFLLTPDSTFRKILASYLRSQDEECFDDQENLNKRISPSQIEISIDAENLVFNFSAYQIAPYACGAPRIKIPRDKFAIKLPG